MCNVAQQTKKINMGIIGNIGQAIAAPLTDTVQSVINAKTQKANVDKTIEANKNMAAYQYSKDIEMWNRQNEYNAPSAQMQRFAEAGLNPNLIYGQGSSGNATQLPKYSAPQPNYDYAPPVNIGGKIAAYQDFKLRQAQTDQVKEQTELTKTQNVIALLNSNWLHDRQHYQGGELGYWHQKMVQQANETSLSLYNAQVRKIQMKMMAESLSASIDNIKARTGLALSQTGMSQRQIELSRKGLPWFAPITNIAKIAAGFIPGAGAAKTIRKFRK